MVPAVLMVTVLVAIAFGTGILLRPEETADRELAPADPEPVIPQRPRPTGEFPDHPRRPFL
jgi:hypothetical protein